MAKDQLIFDVTDATTIADSDSVGAFVRSSDGTLIDHANINAVNRLAVDATLKDGAGTAITSTGGALDVNLVSPITVDTQLEGVYDAVSNANPDNTGVIFHTRAATIGDAQQVERSTAGAVANVLAANISNINALDVNAFAYAKDANGDMTLLSADASGNLDVNIAASSGTINVNDAALANTAIANAAKTLAVADTAESVITSALASRKYLYVYNKDHHKVYVGGTGVSKTNGFPLSGGSYLELRAGAAIDLQFVGETGKTPEIRTLELS